MVSGRWFSVQRFRLTPRRSRCLRFRLRARRQLLVRVNQPVKVQVRRGRKTLVRRSLTPDTPLHLNPGRSGGYTLHLRGKGWLLVYLAFPRWQDWKTTSRYLKKWPQRLRGIPFQEWWYRPRCTGRKRIRFRQGQAQWKHWSLQVRKVLFGNLIGGKQEEVLVQVRCRSKKGSLRDELFLYRLFGGVLRPLRHNIRRGGLLDAGYLKLRVEKKTLFLQRRLRRQKNRMWVERYRWKRASLRRIGRVKKATPPPPVRPRPTTLASAPVRPAPPVRPVTPRKMTPRKITPRETTPQKAALQKTTPVAPVAPRTVQTPQPRPRKMATALVAPASSDNKTSLRSFLLIGGLSLLGLLLLWWIRGQWIRWQKKRLWRELKQPIFPIHEDTQLVPPSVWELFWDLGADNRALLFLHAFDLLYPPAQRDPERVEELRLLWEDAGSYAWWLEQIIPYLLVLPPVPTPGRESAKLRNELLEGLTQTIPFHPESAFTVAEYSSQADMTVDDSDSKFPTTLHEAALCDLFDLYSNSETAAPSIVNAAMRYFRLHKEKQRSPEAVFLRWSQIQEGVPPIVHTALHLSRSLSHSPEQPNLADFAGAYHQFMSLCQETAEELMQGSRKHELLLNMNRPFRFWDERRQATQSLTPSLRELQPPQRKRLKRLMREGSTLQLDCKRELLEEKQALLGELNGMMKTGRAAEAGHLLFSHSTTLLDHMRLEERIEQMEEAWANVLLEAQYAWDRGWLNQHDTIVDFSEP